MVLRIPAHTEQAPTLELGVLDVAYSMPGKQGPMRTTTGQVAEILEDNYHVMGTFFELKKERIAGIVADTMANALNDRLNGHVAADPMYGANQQIEALFRAFLDANEMNTLAQALTGSAISAAAARGVDHRRKQPYARRPARPAFVDTGLYRSSFRALFKLGGTFGPLRPNVAYGGFKNDLDVAV